MGPPRTTVEMNPEFCRASISRSCMREFGIEVRPSRAFVAFCRCEQVFARCTSDIVLPGIVKTEAVGKPEAAQGSVKEMEIDFC